ncbi:hypothetical protein LINGRAHAP2_LOCUS16369 [Linum grandiflorum]
MAQRRLSADAVRSCTSGNRPNGPVVAPQQACPTSCSPAPLHFTSGPESLDLFQSDLTPPLLAEWGMSVAYLRQIINMWPWHLAVNGRDTYVSEFGTIYY